MRSSIQSVNAALSRRMSRRVVLYLFLGLISTIAGVLYFPSWYSFLVWTNHRTMTFEKEEVSVPFGWIPGESGHLLSLKKPGATLLSHWDSAITIDPFAERHPRGLEYQKWQWLRARGKYVDGKVRNPQSGKLVPGFSSAQCVQSESESRALQSVSCLSADSILTYEFVGSSDNFSAFEEIYVQASLIAERHSGTIRP
jgi:hypothetical protein